MEKSGLKLRHENGANHPIPPASEIPQCDAWCARFCCFPTACLSHPARDDGPRILPPAEGMK